MGLTNAKCTSPAKLYGKTVVVTGCNTGIGKCTVKDFYQRGGRVIMACRNEEKAKEAAEEINLSCKDQQNLGEIIIMPLDLSSLQSVKNFVKSFDQSEEKLHLLINNAGVMMCPLSRTEDGFEMQFGTNHLGHFLLTMLLLPKLIASAPSRIVNVSSELHRSCTIDFADMNWETKPYSPLGAYRQSKLANILFTKELKDKLDGHNIRGVHTYSLHPGVIKTDIGRHMSKTILPGFSTIFNFLGQWFMKTPEQGAQTTIYCAVDEKCADESGLYYAECKVARSSDASHSKEQAEKLWKESWQLVGLEQNYDPFLKK